MTNSANQQMESLFHFAGRPKWNDGRVWVGIFSGDNVVGVCACQDESGTPLDAAHAFVSSELEISMTTERPIPLRYVEIGLPGWLSHHGVPPGVKVFPLPLAPAKLNSGDDLFVIVHNFLGYAKSELPEKLSPV